MPVEPIAATNKPAAIKPADTAEKDNISLASAEKDKVNYQKDLEI